MWYLCASARCWGAISVLGGHIGSSSQLEVSQTTEKNENSVLSPVWRSTCIDRWTGKRFFYLLPTLCQSQDGQVSSFLAIPFLPGGWFNAGWPWPCWCPLWLISFMLWFSPVSLCWQGLGLTWKSEHSLWSAELSRRTLRIPVVLLLASRGAFVFWMVSGAFKR